MYFCFKLAIVLHRGTTKTVGSLAISLGDLHSVVSEELTLVGDAGLAQGDSANGSSFRTMSCFLLVSSSGFPWPHTTRVFCVNLATIAVEYTTC